MAIILGLIDCENALLALTKSLTTIDRAICGLYCGALDMARKSENKAVIDDLERCLKDYFTDLGEPLEVIKDFAYRYK